jgi:DUF971 family protein
MTNTGFVAFRHDDTAPVPRSIVVHQQSGVVELAYEDGSNFRLPFELLRVYSPSAEVVGHGPGQEVLQVGKRDVLIQSVEPVGHYAIKPVFSDGHDSGLFSWDYLYWLGGHKESLWQDYLARLEQAGASRDPSALPANKSSSGGCGSGGCS